MKPTATINQLRKLEVMVDRQETYRHQLRRLELELKKVDEAILVAQQDLILGLAREKGLLALPPTQMVAAFAAIHVPVSAPLASEGVLLHCATHEVVIHFGNHEGEKKTLLRSAGLTRNGKQGEWRGHVDDAMLGRLRENFGGKIQSVMQSTPPILDENLMVDASASTEVDCETPEATQAARESAVGSPDAMAKMERETNGEPIYAGGLKVAGHSTSGNDDVATSPPRAPFSALPRRFEPRSGRGDADKL